jgi:hypothetical protein
MKLGYARVSTEDQNLDGQRQRLSVAGCEKLFEEKLSGAKRNRPRDRPKGGVLWDCPVVVSREFGMKWRVMLELVGPDGVVGVHEVGGRAAVAEYAPQMFGLTLEEGKHLLAALQVHLVRAQVEDHCRRWRRCQRCGAHRPLKDQRSRRIVSLFGTVEVRAPAFYPVSVCGDQPTDAQSGWRDHARPMHAGVRADRRKDGFAVTLSPGADAAGGVLPLGNPQAVETIRQRTLRVGTRLEQEAVAGAGSKPAVATKSIALSIDGGHVRAAGQYQGRTFEILLAQVSNDEGRQVVFASVPAEATSQTRQLRGVLQGLGATPATSVTILSDGADGPRSLGEAASSGPTHHVLDWFHLAMRVQHVAQAATSWPDGTETDRQAGARLTETIERIRWRLWHGQVKRALDLIAETAARKVERLLGDLETYVSGQSNIIIDYATARRREEPISTAVTESTVQWLLHRRMNAQQQMRWSPRGAHLMLKVRTSVVNGTLDRDHAVAERWAHRPFRRAA